MDESQAGREHSHPASRRIINFGARVDTIAPEGLKGKPGSDVWRAVRREERFLIKQDLDSRMCARSSPEHMLDCFIRQFKKKVWIPSRAAS
jgi:hypothetical protein